MEESIYLFLSTEMNNYDVREKILTAFKKKKKFFLSLLNNHLTSQ
jgi:hypothetical protein